MAGSATEQGKRRGTGWAGTTLAERRSARREQLIEAGLDLIGAEGSAGVAVRSVCRTAGLTERYFYESFADRQAFLVAVCEDVAGETRQALSDAAAASPPDDHLLLARAVVEAFEGIVLDDPRKGRVLLVEALSEPAMAATALKLARSFATLIHDQLPPVPRGDDGRRTLAAFGLLGALSYLFHAWLQGSLAVDRSELVDHAVRVVVAHASLAAGPPPG